MLSNQPRSLGIAVVGCGTVGSQTVQILLNQTKRLGTVGNCRLELRYVVVRNRSGARAANVPEAMIRQDLAGVLQDPTVDVVVELVGGTEAAKTIIEQALAAKKQVVTANKALLAQSGPALFRLARSNGVCIAFEASCAGGIPIIRALYDGLLANEITAIDGIINGTCNYILTEMIETGTDYAQALADAQAAGFAEADPTMDVSGLDAGHKLGLLASLAFGCWVAYDRIAVRGIDSLEAADAQAAIRLGYSLKLLAQARQTDQGIFARVEPVLIDRHHPLAWVAGSFNAVSVHGSLVGHSLLYGRGAGAGPTASAVVADLLSLAAGTYPAVFQNLAIWFDQSPQAVIQPTDRERRRFYLRLLVQDSPGILAKIAQILSEHAISVASIHQEEVPDDALPGSLTVPVIITAHSCPEKAMRQALGAITQLAGVHSKASLLPILDEHPEFG